ncbi:MAG: hypothetical protein OEV08_14145 [Nitrospira sp.]|nr:hypothetical protein [Nitrospira sp.]
MRIVHRLRMALALACLTGALHTLTPSPSHASELRQGTLTGGAGIGFLGNTPDDTAFAMNLNADYFIVPQLSVGPLIQFAFTGDLFQMGTSGQVKYWLSLPGVDSRLKVNVQGGLGFLYADRFKSDVSWLIPIGIGLDYALNNNLALTATFLLNFTDVNTGRGTDASVMPGLTFGVRF